MHRSTLFLLACAGIGTVALIAMRPPRAPKPPAAATPTPTATPTPKPAPLILPTDPVRGDPMAPLTIIEFADFTCPACAAAEAILGELRETYGQQLRIVWKDLPHLDRLTGSRALHRAARCAHAQGRFWEYHDLLFQSPAPRETAALADRLRLGRDAFRQCLADPTVDRAIAASAAEAERLQIIGTPTFYVRGTLLDPRAPLTRAAFEALLNR